MAFDPIHKHLLIKARIQYPITNAKDGKKLLVDLVKLVGMHPVTKPQAVYVAEEGNKGFTGSINLATSHIAYHIWDERDLLMLDLYSCKEFDTHMVLQFLDTKFGFQSLQFLVFDREDFSVLEHDLL